MVVKTQKNNFWCILILLLGSEGLVMGLVMGYKIQLCRDGSRDAATSKMERFAINFCSVDFIYLIAIFLKK